MSMLFKKRNPRGMGRRGAGPGRPSRPSRPTPSRPVPPTSIPGFKPTPTLTATFRPGGGIPGTIPGGGLVTTFRPLRPIPGRRRPPCVGQPCHPWWYPKARGSYFPFWSYGVPYYPRLARNWFGDNTPQCADPLQNQCRRLNITPRWAHECFITSYRRMRQLYRGDAELMTSAIARELAPDCPFPTKTGAGAEYERRIKLAVAILLNREGIPTPYPPEPVTPRPPEADTVREPWLRALLTGWV